MLRHTTFFDKLAIIQDKTNMEDRIIEILHLYISSYPFENAYLFNYSPLTKIAEGTFMIDKTTGIHICNEIRDDIDSLPFIRSAIQDKKAKFIQGIDFYRNSNLKYNQQSTIRSCLVVPITIGTVVIGYICTTKLNNLDFVDEEILDSLTKFGAFIGQTANTNSSSNSILSKREIETIRRASYGETTKEISSNMLISEFTVNQYIKSVIKKLKAKNRTHAVSILVRDGWI
jgi:DNA-binding CsgD family transcriptional regulator